MADDIILGVNVKGYVAREEVFVDVPEGKQYFGTRVTFPTGASLFLIKKGETENKKQGAEVSGGTSSVTCKNITRGELEGTSGKRDMFFIYGCSFDVNIAQDRGAVTPDNDVVIIKSSSSSKSDVKVTANIGDKVNRLNITDDYFYESIKSE